MSADEQNKRGDAPNFGDALRFWFKLGCISFGGPAGQIAIMQRELVDEKRWISQARFNHALSYCMLLPGPEAQQLATYLGWLMHRTAGGVAAGALFVLPSLLLLMGLAHLYVLYGTQPTAAALLWGVKCAVVALVAHALWRLGSKTLRSPQSAPLLWLIAVSSFCALMMGVSFIAIIAIAGLVGWGTARFGPQAWGKQFHGKSHASAAAAAASGKPAWIDDATPTPTHARWQPKKALMLTAIGLALWATSLWAVGLMGERGAALQTMGGFFTETALVTFGGAYAVLPHVMDAAVHDYKWVSTADMMAGLALGESTPGPLIMVVAFVGQVAEAKFALTQGTSGASLLWAGALGAMVATWFTFLPSFLFILVGGPFVETTHGKLGFQAPLAAISAAVVGVIAHLAVVFALHVLWPQGFAPGLLEGLDVWALALTSAAAFALISQRFGVITTLVLCCAAGGLIQLFAI